MNNNLIGKPAAKIISFYLPQFHPIPENDEWWGKGFTEWTNTAKAKPRFPGHYQPHVPADLGFYDLRLPESRIAQAEMARQYGIDAFCYYHYWFAGKELLERPFKEVLASGEPDFPFCICWANETWTGIWHGAPNRILIEQTYPGEDDHRRHFEALLPAFTDRRYVKIDGKPLFAIYAPKQLPDPKRTTDLWRKLAQDAGLTDLYFVGVTWSLGWHPTDDGFDAGIFQNLPTRRNWYSWSNPFKKVSRYIERQFNMPTVHKYAKVIPYLLPEQLTENHIYPCVIPNWDNSPRSGVNGLALHGSTPELFRRHFRHALDLVKDRPPEQQIVFIKSWNEWAEGNHLEPDLRYGHAYLEAIREELKQQNKL
ncbi:glycosyltransferase WbsX family protein [Candidatus Contendibacter odensensis]|uniref:Lipopolysaccharide biosynthesis protein-like protein n=1 Tax=Candidatus Contendobacter odensis Run_B_J11 TaxID=1400861 RepID=A0A7U7J291_9GAMM|nr:glycoside hydrolase family 99-like domain-containing protein [Candidatus Contendobacter odensis]CDH43068.1 Lipopolysaccharide biosynthesis protein-like protein [Candidatus Contendobacter odensis Run_B_J11]